MPNKDVRIIPKCKRCGTYRAVIRSYGLDICRRCFRETAESMGFRKYH